MQPFIDAAWLARHSDDVVVVDVRWYLDGRSGLVAYQSGHIPEAVFINLENWLAAEGSTSAGRHPLPSPEHFADAMARHGIGDHSTVVAYDDAGGVIAARLVWMLRVTGHDAAVLNGGIESYKGDLETVTTKPPAALFGARAWPMGRLATIDDAVSGEFVVLDARDAERFRGETEPIDPRAGHIPGARNVACRENLRADGTLIDDAELRRRFESAGVLDATRTISYCGSGVTACHNLLAMEQCGLGEARLYPGSWSQYSHDRSRPVATT